MEFLIMGFFSLKGEPTNKSMISRIMWERRHTTEGGWHAQKDQNAFLRKLQKGWDQRQETGQEKEKWVGFQVQCPCRGDSMTNSRTQRCDGKEKGMEMRFLRRGPTDYSKESRLYHSNNRNHPRRPSKGPKRQETCSELLLWALGRKRPEETLFTSSSFVFKTRKLIIRKSGQHLSTNQELWVWVSFPLHLTAIFSGFPISPTDQTWSWKLKVPCSWTPFRSHRSLHMF